MKGNIMKNATATTLTAAQAADIVRTSNNPREIEEAWETAVELHKAGVQDEDIVIALTGWTMNPATPWMVIEDFWKNPEVRLMVDGVWGGVLMEIVALPNTPDEIRKEIAESWQRLWDRHWKTSGKE